MDLVKTASRNLIWSPFALELIRFFLQSDRSENTLSLIFAKLMHLGVNTPIGFDWQQCDSNASEVPMRQQRAPSEVCSCVLKDGNFWKEKDWLIGSSV